jgi:coiled-coil domain-containing protein 130
MQGFNMGRYYPPDASHAPQFNSAHTSKTPRGAQTVRFELPFAVWCTHCTPEAIVGQGVRFNAEKKKVGNYHSTPVWSFRMKHSACGGWWEIRTDPAAAEYTVVEGARRRDYGPDERGADAEGELKFLTPEEREKRRADAFAQLEGSLADKSVQRGNKERVEELYERAETWRDPYDVNARLRRGFRAQRKVWKKEDRHREDMQDKFSLGLDIVDETDADRTRARLIEFGAAEPDEFDATRKPLFAALKPQTMTVAAVPPPLTQKLKADAAADMRRRELQQTLVGNTRAVLDPFFARDGAAGERLQLGILKRKRGAEEKAVDVSAVESSKGEAESGVGSKAPVSKVLVGYESD